MTTNPAPVAPPPPLARNRNFSLLWFGEGVSVLGNATTSILLPLLAVVGFDAGPGWMGVLTAAAWVPWLLIGLPAGAWVDTLPARRVMILSDLAAALTLASVPVAWALDLLTLPHLAVAAFCNGVCTVFFRAAYPALVRQVAPREQQESAFARLFGTESAMQVAGPGAGGLLAQVLSSAGGLLVDAVSFLVSAGCLWRLKLPPAEPREVVDSDQPSLRQRIREGVDYIRQDRILRFFTVVGGISNFGLTGYGALIVLFLVREVHLGSGAVGLVMAVASLGGVLGALIATTVSQRLGSARALLALQLLAGPPALLVPLGAPGAGLVALVAGLLLVGIGVVAGNIVRGAWRNRYVPEHMIARQVTTAQVVNLGTMPLAGLAAGALGSAIGLRPTILVMAAIHVLACLSMYWSPLRGLREMPTLDH
ncbi:Predicted arabinose efflux permease, MFS family [Pedococcus dokdonensis]|uniref:Predicted arabinose efflux permease, MFS family n=1 Tax=Pedococcus dokdonensis TaxID=443156 RepID=A0A1H0P5Q2_9MICO|nr:MFS transporter [Pedococcus dokdonensis]SDP00020.1 Predicted arabinose efflux permease, MFS family [Pedococcus dokdonensis]